MPVSASLWAATLGMNASLGLNATEMLSHRLLTSKVQHETHHSGTLCVGSHLAPSVMLIGAQRCGTGSLYEDLMTHVKGARRGHALRGEPDFYAREQHFFATDSWSEGVHHYLLHFPDCPHHGSDFSFAVDATPAYLRKPIVASRLFSIYSTPVVAKLKFIIILRDPAKRLYAYWDNFVQSGTGVNNFAVWVEQTLRTVKECQKRHGSTLWPPPDTVNCDADDIESVAAGLYAYQLRFWFEQFDAKHFFLTSLDAYERDTAAVLRDAANFIGASRDLVGTPRAVGAPANPLAVKVLGAMPSAAKTALARFYHEHNQELLRLFNHEPHVTYSPSLKALDIQAWASP